MPKFLKWSLITIAVLGVVAFAGFQYMKAQTKKASPEETLSFFLNDLTVEVTYSRPSKKGRAIFGSLVPYGKVWRTGANEATTFKVNKDIVFGDKPVKAGTYTLWTIPGPEEWTVILNSKMYGWGLKFDGESPRDALADVAQYKARVERTAGVVEQFTISMDQGDAARLVLAWDDVQVAVPVAH
jgi:hypothetical protein